MNLAFHNDETLAARVRTQVSDHVAADEIIQGKYWEDGKGCFIGCIAHGDSASTVEQLTGFPLMLTRIAENIFEGLANDVAKNFPERVILAPRVGADLSLVGWKFLHWTVADALDRFGTENVRIGCKKALEILQTKASGGEVTSGAAAAAADAVAYSAYAAAAYSAADAADAAYSADAADAADAARAAYAATIIRQADKIIELLVAAV